MKKEFYNTTDGDRIRITFDELEEATAFTAVVLILKKVIEALPEGGSMYVQLDTTVQGQIASDKMSELRYIFKIKCINTQGYGKKKELFIAKF
jgi:hypothetical protein